MKPFNPSSTPTGSNCLEGISSLMATAYLRHRLRMLEKSTRLEWAADGVETALEPRPAVDVVENGVKA